MKWLLALAGLVVVCVVVTAGRTAEPPDQTIKRLRADNAALRFQLHYARRMNNQLTWKIRGLLANIDVLFKRIDALNNELTDCRLKLPPPPVGP
jgi:hypothetical protein